MNKEQFKNLDILAQIEYVNNILKEGKTLTAFSEEVEISRKTISKNFSKFGYKYSQSKKQYILANTDVQAGGRKKYYSNITESNIKSTPKKEEFNMPGYIRKNSKQKRHPTISWTPFYNYKSLIESLYNSNHNAIEIL